MTKLQELFDALNRLDWKYIGRNSDADLKRIDALMAQTGMDGIAMKMQFVSYYMNPFNESNPIRPIRPE
jgi:hypothetical protein